MARTVEASNHGIPQPPDTEAWRHFGDGYAGKLVAARLQGYDPIGLGYVDVQVDSSGVLQTAGGGGGGGAVTQGTVPWVVSNAGTFAVQASWASAQHVIVDTAPTTAVTLASIPNPPNLDVAASTLAKSTQLPAALVGGRLSVDIGAQALAKLLATVDPVTFASPQHVIVDTAPSTAVTNAGTFAVQASWASAQHVIVDSGAENVTVQNASLPVTQSGAWTAGRTWTLGSGTDSVSASVSNFPATQPVSGTVTATNTGFNATGTDGITAGLAATVKTYNGTNAMFVRDPNLAGIMSEILMELRLANSSEEAAT